MLKNSLEIKIRLYDLCFFGAISCQVHKILGSINEQI